MKSLAEAHPAVPNGHGATIPPATVSIAKKNAAASPINAIPDIGPYKSEIQIVPDMHQVQSSGRIGHGHLLRIDDESGLAQIVRARVVADRLSVNSGADVMARK
ncbi:MAG TPA: hypothetical protein VHZ30_05990 [Verrucomicrobiae bacterium]|jgi:hypothetical protein|nr:hypothetical protein [Verrucomicrobiae bacterium]